MTMVRTDVPQETEAQLPPGQPNGFGYGPASLQSAYNLPSTQAGAGQTVAVVDAYDDPNAAADLAVYRAAWGLPACNTSTGAGCLTKLNQSGGIAPLPAPAGNTGWATEESVDVDMVSAICPGCQIVLAEANSNNLSDLAATASAAVRGGAAYVSNSYGGLEYPGELSLDYQYSGRSNVIVTAAAGDSGYGTVYPAASIGVAAVGGTSLYRAPTSRGWTETAWFGTGSGCSSQESKAYWQVDPGCSNRTLNDVSALADPATGVAVYDTYDRGGWLEAGGTGVSSPVIASAYALAAQVHSSVYPTSYPYLHPTRLNDVVSGSNGSCSPAYLCTAGPGYDGPTGMGTPNGTTAFSGSGTAMSADLTLGLVDRNGAAYVKQGGLAFGWAQQYGGVSQIAVASDQVNGRLVAVLTGSGEVFARYGTSGAWVDEGGGYAQVADATDPVHGPLLVALTTGGEAFAKLGGLSAGWVDEYSGVARVAAASDATGGPLISVLTSGGIVLAKQGGLSSPWVVEYAGATQIAAASDSAHGPLLAIRNSAGSLLAKQGGLSAGWVDEYDGVYQFSVASDPVNGPLIAMVTNGSEAFAKEGGLSTNWVDEGGGAAQIAAGSDPGNGPLLAELLGSGDAQAMTGSLTGGWTAQYSGATQVAAAG
jgi:hypothetical protein